MRTTPDELIAAIESASSLMLGVALDRRVPPKVRDVLNEGGCDLDELAREYWEERGE